MPLRPVPLASLRQLDPSLLRIPVVEALLARLARDRVRFLVPARGRASEGATDFLNRTFWTSAGDVLASREAPVDVLAHAAWHHVVRAAAPRATVESALVGEAIASAFDLYLVGAALRVAPDADLLATQVPRLSEAAADGGMGARAFATVLKDAARDPEKVFGELYALLADAALKLAAVDDPVRAAHVVDALATRRLGPLLFHYDVSGWLLHARAHATTRGADAAARAIDRTIRRARRPITALAGALL